MVLALTGRNFVNVAPFTGFTHVYIVNLLVTYRIRRFYGEYVSVFYKRIPDTCLKVSLNNTSVPLPICTNTIEGNNKTGIRANLIESDIVTILQKCYW